MQAQHMQGFYVHEAKTQNDFTKGEKLLPNFISSLNGHVKSKEISKDENKQDDYHTRERWCK